RRSTPSSPCACCTRPSSSTRPSALLRPFHAVGAAHEFRVPHPPAVQIVLFGRGHLIAPALVGVDLDARLVAGDAVALSKLAPVGDAAFVLGHAGAAGEGDAKGEGVAHPPIYHQAGAFCDSMNTRLTRRSAALMRSSS